MNFNRRHFLIAAFVSLMIGRLEAADSSTGSTVGIASWYADRFHQKRTASGEPYLKDALTAAHRSLPFGTMVHVENLRNGKSVIVKINDRGPFHSGRIIDVSRAAAKELGFIRQGETRVRLTLVNP